MVIMRVVHVDRALKFTQHSCLICVHNSPEGSREEGLPSNFTHREPAPSVKGVIWSQGEYGGRSCVFCHLSSHHAVSQGDPKLSGECVCLRNAATGIRISLVGFFLDLKKKMRTIFKVFIEFVIILLLFYVLFFWPQCMWDRLGIESTLLALEAQVLTTGLPGESLHGF